jgi:AmmeMemoRadiSam system protein A
VTETDHHILLGTARTAIEHHVHSLPARTRDLSGPLSIRAGAFVSLHHDGQLRGCIGHIEGDEVLGILVPRSAIAACSADPRFEPVAPHELPALQIEISVLGPFESVTDESRIVIGRDGLFVEEGWRRGLLLPQVATEWGWDREAFLAQTCHKAGLPIDAWKRGARVWRFEAEVFHE